jgi:exopolysaccharide production protein ExoQ
MPPILALGLCVALIVFLIGLTTQSQEGRSPALVIPTVWMMLSASKPVAVWFSSGEAAMAESSMISGSLPDQLVRGLLMLLAAAVLFKRRLSLRQVLRENAWLFMLLAYMAISILWSDYPLTSFKRWVRGVGVVLCAMVVLTEKAPQDAFEIIVRRTIYVLIPLSIVLIKYFPDLGIDYSEWEGMRMPMGAATHKNTLGILCTLSALFLVWDLLRKRRLRLIRADRVGACASIFVLVMTLYLLKGADSSSYSATSLGVLIIGLSAMFTLSRLRAHPDNITPLGIMLAIALVLAVAIGSIIMGSPASKLLTGLLGRDATLTGRIDIWARVFEILGTALYVWPHRFPYRS